MGVDYTSVVLFGVSGEIDMENLPEIIKSYLKEVDAVIWQDAPSEFGKTEKEKETLTEFIGFTLYKNSYSSECEGAGYEVDLNNPDKEIIAKSKKLFKKYNLGEPKFVNFVHMW